jgi:hypothetical protein
VCPPQLFLLGGAHCEPSPLRGRRLDLDVQETTIFDWQDWLRDHVIGKIPGASS